MTTTFQSPHWLSDDEITQKGVPPESVEMYRRYHYQQKFGLNTWYPTIPELTFPTQFLTLTSDDVSALLLENRNFKKEPKSPSDDKYAQEPFKSLISRIDEAIRQWNDVWVFVKLNTRSPKDIPIHTTDKSHIEKIVTWVEKDLCAQQCKKYDKSRRDELMKQFSSFDVMAAFTKACTRFMRVKSGKEALDFLISSQRIYEDLSRVEEFGRYGLEATLAIRRWDESIVNNPGMEFRGFVYQNQLNAVTQYDDSTYFPEVACSKAELSAQILKFFNEKVKEPLSSFENYVIDFFVCDHETFIIELNPFHIGAGAGLFSWKEHRDLFMNGPFEFRVVTSPPLDPLAVLPSFWERTLRPYLTTSDDEETTRVPKMLAYAAVPVLIGTIAYLWSSNRRT